MVKCWKYHKHQPGFTTNVQNTLSNASSVKTPTSHFGLGDPQTVPELENVSQRRKGKGGTINLFWNCTLTHIIRLVYYPKPGTKRTPH